MRDLLAHRSIVVEIEPVVIPPYLAKVNLIQQQLALLTDAIDGIKSVYAKNIVIYNSGNKTNIIDISSYEKNVEKLIRTSFSMIKALEHDGNWIDHGPILFEQLKTMSEDYYASERSHLKFVRQRVIREYSIAHPNASNDEVEEYVVSGRTQVFQDAMIRKTYDDIIARHQDILLLEESLIRLQQMFVDFQMLVESQGETINLIEDNVDSALKSTTDALVEIKYSLESQKSARKKYICLSICCIILLIVIIIPLVIHFNIVIPMPIPTPT
jgi:t-SNARE complex subunit (syntaxin)